MIRSLSEQISFVFGALRALDINVKPGSRLDQLAKVFRADDGSWTMSVPIADAVRFEHALESRREFQLFEFILNPWEFRDEELPLEKLRVAALKDHALQYAQAKSETPGRDTQLELYVATTFRRSGAGAEVLPSSPHRKTPDVRTRACGRYFFVEAKRVKARARIVDAISDAVGQVDATGCPGAAFVDVTMAFNEENRYANENLRRDQVQEMLRGWLQGQFEPLRNEVDAVMTGSRLTSIFLQYHLLIPIDGEVELRSTLLTYPEQVEGRYAREDAEVRRLIDLGWKDRRPQPR